MMGIVRYITGVLLTATVIALSVLLIPGLPPDIDFKPFLIDTPSEAAMNLLNSNDVLEKAELYYESPSIGMESVVELTDGSIITSDQRGTIFKITTDQTIVNITHLKFPCEKSLFGGGGMDGINSCGWGLGMRFVEKEQKLYFIDYFGGLIKLDLKTGSYETLVPKYAKIHDKTFLHPEDLDVAKDGTIYWTDGSTTESFFTEMLSQPSGRLYKYDPAKKTSEVLLDDLHFPNGVCLSANEDFVIVAEMGSYKIRRYYLRGEKKGKSETFISGLPGVPDNIRTDGKGGFYVALFQPWNEYSMNTPYYSARPVLRKFILRLRNILLALIKRLQNVEFLQDNVFLNDIETYIVELQPILRIRERPNVAILAEVSNSGEITKIFSGQSGKMPNLSQVTIGKTFAYLACPFDTKLWRIDKNYLK